MAGGSKRDYVASAASGKSGKPDTFWHPAQRSLLVLFAVQIACLSAFAMMTTFELMEIKKSIAAFSTRLDAVSAADLQIPTSKKKTF